MAREAARFCAQRGTDISFLAMQFCYAQPQISSTITGAAVVHELEINLRALMTPIDQQLVAEVQEILRPVLNETWASGNWKE